MIVAKHRKAIFKKEKKKLNEQAIYEKGIQTGLKILITRLDKIVDKEKAEQENVEKVVI